MAKSKTKSDSAPVQSPSVSSSELAQALVQAIEASRPSKKTVTNRKKDTPWTPKDGSAKLKLKRKMHQHGVIIDEDKCSNQEVALLNKVRPGVYLDGYVKIYRRKDRGLDIDYSIKTASQKLRLVNQFGIRNLSELLERCVYEADHPRNIDLEETQD